jgi:hypothetical protein
MKIAVSGSYSTGKTTTTIALSLLTGLEMIHARTMREILPVVFPGKRLEECNPGEIVELIFTRLQERIVEETKHPGEYVSDGSFMQEWAYCAPRVKYGMNPSERRIVALWKKHTAPAQWKTFKETMEVYGKMVRQRLNQYDLFIHLPIEFPLTADGHRPVNERFRSMCDRLLRNTYMELALPVYEVKGSIQERLELAVRYLQLSPKMDVHEAIAISKQIVKERFNSIKLETQS